MRAFCIAEAEHLQFAFGLNKTESNCIPIWPIVSVYLLALCT